MVQRMTLYTMRSPVGSWRTAKSLGGFWSKTPCGARRPAWRRTFRERIHGRASAGLTLLISTAAGLRQPLGQGSTRSAAALRESSELSGG